MLEAIVSAFVTLFTPNYLMFFLLGTCLGLIMGVVPGLGGLVGLALLLPFVNKLGPKASLPLLISLLSVISTSGCITAILLGSPGGMGSSATLIDGYPLARKGEAGKALGAGFTVSGIGGIFGAVVLTLSIPIMRPIVLAFGSPEFLAMCILGITTTSLLVSGRALSGIIAAALGLLLGMIGQDPIHSVPRWTFGITYLLDGIGVVCLALGIFAIPEIIDLCVQGTQIAEVKYASTGKMDGFREAFRHKSLVASSAVVGAVVGFMPAMGSVIANWLAYSWAKLVCKPKDMFGKGDIRGVIAPEAADNACIGGDLIPTIAFGIPGSTAMALVLAAFYLMGIVPGPQLITQHLDLVYLMVWSLALANVIGATVCFLLTDQIALLTRVPIYILAPLVTVVMFAGSLFTKLDIGDVVTLLACGVLGWLMKHLKWPRPPLILGFIFSDIMEKYYFQATMVFGAAWMVRPLVMIILAIAALCIYASVRIERRLKIEEGEDI